ncbi:MAG: beta-glucoside-specific PTS transporter subunit IIABC [Anaerorhabdus sp.]
MGKYAGLAKQIIMNVGGKSNIISVTHCITRLRFKLKDEEKCNTEVLKNMDGVVTVMRSGGQYQVVIGNHVPHVFEEVEKIAKIKTEVIEEKEKTTLLNGFINILSSVFQPFLGVLAASGMLKGILALLITFNLIDQAGVTYSVLYNIADAVFYFIPVMVGYNASKKFKLNVMVGLAISLAICMPAMQADSLKLLGESLMIEPVVMFSGVFKSVAYVKFLGIPLFGATYTNSVLPIILIIYFASKVEKYAKKILPEMIQTFFVPFTVMVIAVPVGLLIIGPIMIVFTNVLQGLFQAIIGFNPIVYGVILGLVWQVLVIFGLHWSVVAILYLEIATYGVSQVLVPIFTASFAQTAAVLAMFFKSKNEKTKSLAIPSIISGIMGITEPAIYGITLPAKKPFIFSCIGAAIGGGMMMFFDLIAYRTGGLGIFGVMNYIDIANNDNSGMYFATISVIVASLIAFGLTYFFYKETSNKEKPNNKISNDKVYAPMSGKICNLKDVDDEAFALGTIGKGVAILPSDGKVYAPFSGTITALFPTKHAVGLVSDNGMDLLIHIGINTVELEGEYFESFIKQNDKVEKGQLLISFDMEKIKAQGYSLMTPVIITNMDDYLDIIPVEDVSEVVKDDIIINAIIR